MERYAPNLKDLASRDVVIALRWTRRSRKGAAAVRTRTTCCSSSTTSAPTSIMKRLPCDPRDRDQVRQRRSDQGADPGRADDPLPDGRHPDQHPRPGRRAEGRRSERGRRRASTRSANAPACRCTAPTGSAPTRCSTCSCSAAPPATTSSSRNLPAQRAQAAAGATPATRRCARLARLDARDVAASACRTSRNDLRKTMQAHCGVFRNQELLAEGVAKVMELERARAAHRDQRQVPKCSTPRASRRSSSTT